MREAPKKPLRQSEGMYLEESVSKRFTKSCEHKNKLMGAEDTPLSGPENKDWEWQSWKILPSEFTQKTGVISASSLITSRSLKIFNTGLIMNFLKSAHDWEVGGVS